MFSPASLGMKIEIPSLDPRLPMGGLLNDRYELDGRDPRVTPGIAWALAGKHDRLSLELPWFGQVRYMSLASFGRKFD